MTDDTVFITGASAGIGEAVARRMAKRGARLVLAARRRDRLEALAAELGVPCHVAAFDVRDASAAARAVADLPEEFRAITVLVNNAGLALGMGPAQQANLDDWNVMVDTNVKGLLAMTHAVLPRLVARNRGHVVNLGSVAGTYPYPGGHVYAATKAFVHQLSLALRADVVGTRVRVSCIEPGFVASEFQTVRFKGDAARAEKLYEGLQVLSADDIAETIEWVVTRPAHVNVNTVELMTVQQAFGPFALARR